MLHSHNHHHHYHQFTEFRDVSCQILVGFQTFSYNTLENDFQKFIVQEGSLHDFMMTFHQYESSL